MARRLHGVTASPEPEQLTERVAQIAAGAFEGGLTSLMQMDLDGLKAQYAAREIEKESEETL